MKNEAFCLCWKIGDMIQRSLVSRPPRKALIYTYIQNDLKNWANYSDI